MKPDASPTSKTKRDTAPAGTAARSVAAAARPRTDADILRQRARQLARPAVLSSELTPSAPGECLVFELAGQAYALPAELVREVVPASGITRLPGLPATLRGLANVRSRIVPAFDLRPLLHLRGHADAAAREILLIVAWEGAEFGLLVDRLDGVQPLDTAHLRTSVAALQAQYLRGITPDGKLLLDVAAIAAALTLDERRARP